MAIMKRFFSILCVALLFFAISCSNSNPKLKNYINEFNKVCPVTAGEFGEVTGARLDGDNVIKISIEDVFSNLKYEL